MKEKNKNGAGIYRISVFFFEKFLETTGTYQQKFYEFL